MNTIRWIVLWFTHVSLYDWFWRKQQQQQQKNINCRLQASEPSLYVVVENETKVEVITFYHWMRLHYKFHYFIYTSSSSNDVKLMQTLLIKCISCCHFFVVGVTDSERRLWLCFKYDKSHDLLAIYIGNMVWFF